MGAQPIQLLIEASRELSSPEAFARRFPHPFLVREATGNAVPVREDRGTARLSRSANPTTGDGFADRDLWVFPLRRRGQGDGAEDDGELLIGRGEDCDVVIDDGSLSRVHASFSIVANPDADDDDDDPQAYYIADAGSSNGTFVNGDRVEAGAWARVSDMDSLRFGPAVKLQFFSAAGFFQFLSAYRRIKKTRT